MKKLRFPTIGFTSLAVTLLFFATSCDTQKPTSDSSNVNNEHVAKNSLDYDGIYRGILPCADCEGIKTTIYLMKDNTYKIVRKYLGKESKASEEKGKFSWNNAGNTISLKQQNQTTQFFVGENTLTQLDQSGNKITGNLASNYMLTKGNYSILNRKWKLVEIMGQPVTSEQINGHEAFIQFHDNDDRYSANGGCNTMNGSFKVDGYNRISFGKGMSTMMACTNMDIERKLADVISRADNFSVDGDQLVLNKARMAPLAKFVAPVN